MDHTPMFLKCLENNPLLDPYTYCTLVAKAVSLQLNNCTLPGRLTVLFVTISNQKLEGGKACLRMTQLKWLWELLIPHLISH